MIGTAFILLCATAVNLADLDDTDNFYENGCPKDTNIDKLLPHENCGQYYQCFHGALISRFCPNGLNFNADLERCDWHSRCNVRVEVNKTVFEELDSNNPRDASLICSSPDSNDVLVAHENCDEFYKCSHGRPVALKCAPNLLYNTLTEKCDLEDNVDCGERVGGISESTFTISKRARNLKDPNSIEEIKNYNLDPSQASILCKSSQSDGMLIAHEYCHMFYKCSRGIPVTVRCPNKLFYDPIKGHCDWPVHVHCGNRIIPKDDSNINAVTEEKSYDYEENETSGGDEDTSINGLCAAENTEGVVAPHEKCNQFYKCSGKEPVAFECPGNLLFNTKKAFCDWPNNVDCGARAESVGSYGSKEKKARIICSAKGSDGVMATHQRCDKFYKCRDGLPVGIKCPGMLLYNSKTQKCDWPTHVNCTNRTVPKNGHPPHIYYSKDDIDSESGNHNEDNNDENNIDRDKTNIEKENSEMNNFENERGYENNVDNRLHGDNNIENEIANAENNLENGNVYANKKSRNIASEYGKINLFLKDASRICASTVLFLLYATAISLANSDDIDLDGFYENGCPIDASIKKFMPHEDCRQYYKCHHGGQIARYCPNGLHFNAEKERCEWMASCQQKLIREYEKFESGKESDSASDNNNVEELDSDNPGDAIKICESPDSTGVLVAHENCNEFYKCTYGRPVSLKCARNLLFNTMTEKCDWAHNVDCGERISPAKDKHFTVYEAMDDVTMPYLEEEIEHSNSDPNQANLICSNKNSDGVLIAHEYCNRFYKCVAGAPYTVKCPINLLFNPIKGHCDWPRKVDCDNRIISDEEQINEEQKIETKKKEIPSVVQNRLSKRAVNICASKKSEGVAIAHELCSHFYKCSKKEPVAFSCPGNLLFNAKQNYCDWPKKVDCGDRTVIGNIGERDSSEDNDTGDFRQAVTVCSAEGSDGVMLAHDRCNKFYECHDGHPVVVECAPKLLYNPETESCDWPTYVNCSDRKYS
ncbi:hypothetical protein PYW08_002765 [Mythimna loreyi]|uniref:Uncharacterized protein n=1 Tax=Mythimna loreyi TaxID=667449 RepID=A0ACC2QIT8_9NEOP|nr:hypothetical protein PYW08_002765 [Mythimna loreyi]